MSAFKESWLALFGVWRLIRLDMTAIGLFGDTASAARRSMIVFIIAALVHGLVTIQYPNLPLRIDHFFLGTVVVLSRIIAWAAFLLLIYPHIIGMGRGALFLRFVTVYNWLLLLVPLIDQVTMLLRLTSFMPEIINAVYLLTTLAILYIRWRAVQITLDLNGQVAAYLVALDVFIRSLLTLIAIAFIYVQ
ncbi:MAG: hypothetical protein U9N14_01070 [Pseudomonadota bacterium]|nr:hypothetical protein [Pseudomonadota bacterium]